MLKIHIDIMTAKLIDLDGWIPSYLKERTKKVSQYDMKNKRSYGVGKRI
jgi:hypothetical protein